MNKNLKRLIKATIYEGFKDKNIGWVEVFKNPTQREIEDTKKGDPEGAIRGVILDNGDIYIWPGSNFLHDDINKYLTFPINMNEFRFAYETEYIWEIEGNYKYSNEEIFKMILKHESILSQIGDINAEFLIWRTETHEKLGIMSIEEIKSSIENNDIN